MRFFLFFALVSWNIMMFCQIYANDRMRELYFPSHYFFAERRLINHKIRTIHVKDLDNCERLCYQDDNCVSLNIKDKDPDMGTHECELNNSTHLEHDGDFKSDPVYYYRGAKNACGKERQQCENNGVCQSGFTDKGYRCLCTPGFLGEHCEKESWISMAPPEVCFGSKDDSYGAFKILVPGKIITFKLTYLNGSVSCFKEWSILKSNWGCRHPILNSTNMGTHITYSNKTRLLPKTEYLKGDSGCLQLYYHLPWVTIDSSELVFDNLSAPLAVSANEEFQVWFAEDLINCGDEDNGVEKTCARVHGLYV